MRFKSSSFYLFINELPVLLEHDKVDPFILPNGEKMSSLLYDNLINAITIC